MGVVGTEVVPQLMGNNVQIPGIIVDVGARGTTQIRTEAVRKGAAIGAQISDASRAGVGSFGQQVGDVSLDGIQRGRSLPSAPEVVQHGACVVVECSHRISRLPKVYVARL